MKLRNRTAALLAIPALTLALAACSDDDATVVTDAPEATKLSEAVSGDDTGATTTTDGNATTTTTEAPIGQSAAVVQVAGADVDGDFTPVRCTLDGDELDIEIGGDDDDGAGHVDIDIKDPNGTPVLDSLDIDSANIDIEIDDDNADNAVVNRDGDTWTITGTGKYDDEDRTDEVRVEVVCPV
ncbi:lipoprotein LpqH [Corynebacterium freneyi]|uniref:lipoprotein LpqH n=1 Tax=Corynebacterium freneyi TaxID=134034 RepID=UPI00396D0175